MAKKVLVADDSLTIQKVVGITLANQPFEIEEVHSEEDLIAKVGSTPYSLVLLDFNLSDENSGYDLSKKVKELCSDCSIIVMLGTFDTIDEANLEANGIDDFIIKPFESEKFIQKCQKLAGIEEDDDEYEDDEDEFEDDEETLETEVNFDSDEPSETELPTLEDEDELTVSDTLEAEEEVDPDDNWVMKDASENNEIEDDLEEASPVEMNVENPLSNELEGWGLEVPDKILGDDSDEGTVPEVIDGPTSKLVSFDTLNPAEESEEEGDANFDPDATSSFDLNSVQGNEPNLTDDGSLLPSDDDLGYPDIGGGPSSPQAVEDAESSEESAGPKSKLVSLDELAPDSEPEEEEVVVTDPSYNIPTKIDEDLQKEIDDDVSPDEFWAVDDGSGVNHHSDDDEHVVASATAGVDFDLPHERPIEQILEVEQTESHKASTPEYSTSAASTIDEDKIVDQIKTSLEPLIKDLVKDICAQKIEQIAWEVIPDLAENLIKKELNDLSKDL